MINIGQNYELAVLKSVDFGVYLDAKNLGELLLPQKYVPQNLSTGDMIDVFIYLDSEDRPVATTQTPKATVEQFAYLEVVATTDIGAFLDWGLEKDVLVPFAEQHQRMIQGHSYLVYLYLNKMDGRITASSKIDKFIHEETPFYFKPQQAVDLIIANSTDLGFKAIINHSHWGVLYKNEVFERLSFGQSKKGFIKRIRADGKIDLSLKQGGQETRDQDAETIISYLKYKQGFAPIHAKTNPDVIKKLLGMSKGAFKKAIGGLYKKHVISIEDEGIRLLEKD